MNKILVCVGTSGISAGAEKVADNFEAEVKKNKLSFKVIRSHLGHVSLFQKLFDFIFCVFGVSRDLLSIVLIISRNRIQSLTAVRFGESIFLVDSN